LANFKSLRHRLEAGILRALTGGLKRLSIDRASALGAGLLGAIGPLLGGPNRVARTNLARVVPEPEIPAILKGMWSNLGRVVFEYPKLNDILLDPDPGRIEIRGGEVFERANALGKGGIFVAAHQANWELFSCFPQRLGFDVLLIYRAPNNPQVSDLVQEMRPHIRTAYVPKGNEGMKVILKTISKGGWIGFLTDHKYNQGVAVDFLGATAMLAPTAAILARRFGCPIIATRMERIEGARFRATLDGPYFAEGAGSEGDVLQATMQTVMNRFETWIKERPEQWFWMQKLWPDYAQSIDKKEQA
jgi:KDO2-lipid IV(A) lauroyltransferase